VALLFSDVGSILGCCRAVVNDGRAFRATTAECLGEAGNIGILIWSKRRFASQLQIFWYNLQ